MENEFESIRPYNDREAAEAIHRVARHPVLPLICKSLFPDVAYSSIREAMLAVNGVDDFQQNVMSKAVESVIERTTGGFTYSGLENIAELGSCYLAVSNHRDIVLDSAFTQYMLHCNGLPLTENCVGSNLLAGRTVEDLFRSNRMIKVVRGVSARELYFSSQLLSKYIRTAITSGKSSVWIAQREGRTKNGLDTTEQGVLKMFDMSGQGSFRENFRELHIVPFSISYEYDSCDWLKARELLVSSRGKYVKKPMEDMHSILAGIRQWKGKVHLSIGTPLGEEEIERASKCVKNDRYLSLCSTLDERIRRGYHLWKTNYIACDLLDGRGRYSDRYTAEEAEEFREYTEKKLDKIEKRLNRDALRDIFWQIYANPVKAGEE